MTTPIQYWISARSDRDALMAAGGDWRAAQARVERASQGARAAWLSAYGAARPDHLPMDVRCVGIALGIEE